MTRGGIIRDFEDEFALGRLLFYAVSCLANGPMPLLAACADARNVHNAKQSVTFRCSDDRFGCQLGLDTNHPPREMGEQQRKREWAPF